MRMCIHHSYVLYKHWRVESHFDPCRLLLFSSLRSDSHSINRISHGISAMCLETSKREREKKRKKCAEDYQ